MKKGNTYILLGIIVMLVSYILVMEMKDIDMSKKLGDNSKVGKCLYNKPLQKFDKLEGLNMMRILHIDDKKVVGLHYSDPSLLNRFKGDYSIQEFQLDEEIVEGRTLRDYPLVKCKRSLKHDIFKTHMDYDYLLKSYNIKSLKEGDNDALTIEFNE